MKKKIMWEAYDKVIKIIRTSRSDYHFEVCHRVIENFKNLYNGELAYLLFRDLENKLTDQKIKTNEN